VQLRNGCTRLPIATAVAARPGEDRHLETAPSLVIALIVVPGKSWVSASMAMPRARRGATTVADRRMDQGAVRMATPAQMDHAEGALLHADSAQAREDPAHKARRRVMASADHLEATTSETDLASLARIVMVLDRVDLAAALDRLQIENFRGEDLME
jgi:hypothetical protein